MDYRILPAQKHHLPAIFELLQLANLPIVEVEENLENFLIAEADGRVVGCIGMETYDKQCLLRSLVVHPDYRLLGIGKSLTEEILELAKRRGMKEAVILTATVADLATRFGFEEILRDAVNLEMRNSTEFKLDCCRNARCMRLKL